MATHLREPTNWLKGPFHQPMEDFQLNEGGNTRGLRIAKYLVETRDVPTRVCTVNLLQVVSGARLKILSICMIVLNSHRWRGPQPRCRIRAVTDLKILRRWCSEKGLKAVTPHHESHGTVTWLIAHVSTHLWTTIHVFCVCLSCGELAKTEAGAVLCGAV